VALLAILPATIVLIAAALGRAARDNQRPWTGPRVLAPTMMIAAACATLAATGIDPGVSTRDAVTGVALAAILGALPVIAAYTVGYAIRRPWAAALVLLVAAVPLFYYALFAVIWVADLVYCPPDAYECPL
jgi:hypothetical protein